jgi:2-oxoglutarate dehydrogenase E1 component
MLRTPVSSSPLAALTHGRFQPVIPDPGDGSAKRVLICSGKIGHEINASRKNRNDSSTALIFLEQLYPFPQDELAAEMDRHVNAVDFVWVQEEPANMGAFSYVFPQLERLSGGRPVLSVKRSASASPATGSHKAHEMEQRTLIALALGSAAGDLGNSGAGHGAGH